MSYVNTGFERCKTLTIDKTVGGVSLAGYPKEFNLLAAFTQGEFSYDVLTEQEFQRLEVGTYEARLAAFKQYVQAAEGIYSVDDITEEGYEAVRENTTACPIGVGEE